MPIVASPDGAVLSSLPNENRLPDEKDRSWRESIRLAIREPRALAELVQLSPDWVQKTFADAPEFPLFVPREYAARIRPGDASDPLLLQILPTTAERNGQGGASLDPVGDAHSQRAPGMLHKYHGRVLLIVAGACAVHCRYCFRRHFPYSERPHSLADWEPAMNEIARDESLHEVILSGGDPLMLVDGQLAQITERLATIPQLARLRIHTRLPIVIPHRVTKELLAWLAGGRLAPIVVVHVNHVAELDTATAAALTKLRSAGVTLLNQAVLLRGVNDSFDDQLSLCERLVDLGVLPYYLHQLDRVTGAMHFEVPIEQGRAIITQLREYLPGYAVPRYVQENAGESHKSILA